MPLRYLLGLLAAGMLLVSGMSCGRKAPPAQRPAAPVTVAKAVVQDLPVELRTFGQARPRQTIAVRSRVGGELTEVKFREGDIVKEGQELFTIDPRPLQAQVNELEANLNRDVARAELAKRVRGRQEEMYKKGATSQDELDIAVTTAKAAEATVEADRAAVETAKLQLSFAHIRSPVTGVAGKWLINRGNVVKANDDVLVVVNQTQPIDVLFALPQQHLAEIRRYQAGGPRQVRAYIPGSPPPARGKLTFIDNTVDQRTGTINLMATFDNEDSRLWPGQYIEAVLVLTERPGAVVVPSQAIQASQQGFFVFVVRPDETAEVRPVTTGIALGARTSIERGLGGGETVVTDGQLNLAPGSKVRVVGTTTVPAGDANELPAGEYGGNGGSAAPTNGGTGGGGTGGAGGGGAGGGSGGGR